MAGSYRHIITKNGNLRSNESFVDMIENLGDAYEMAEEMYGMIWWLARLLSFHHKSTGDCVEEAREQYREGLQIARDYNRKGRGRLEEATEEEA